MKRLPYLGTQADSRAEAFYQAMGYRHLGELPDYACTPDGYCPQRPSIISASLP